MSNLRPFMFWDISLFLICLRLLYNCKRTSFTVSYSKDKKQRKSDSHPTSVVCTSSIVEDIFRNHKDRISWFSVLTPLVSVCFPSIPFRTFSFLGISSIRCVRHTSDTFRDWLKTWYVSVPSDVCRSDAYSLDLTINSTTASLSK